MKLPLFAGLVCCLGVLATIGRASTATGPEFATLGPDTFSVTRSAATGFTRNTDALKTLALEDAASYCAKLHKQLQVVSVTTYRPKVPLTGFANAKVVFKAIDPNDAASTPAVAAVPSPTAPSATPPTTSLGATPAAPAVGEIATPVDPLYYGLLKLEDLRQRGLLTEEEFQAQRKELVEKSK